MSSTGIGSTSSTTSSTTDEAKAQASNLAGSTRDEAANVAEEAKAQARNVMDDALTMVDDQSRTQRDRLVETARGFSGDLEQMAQSGPDGLAGDVTRQVADKVRALSEHLDGREPSDLLEDVRDFARRRPGLFLLGALGAGVAFGRLTRGAKDARSGSSAQSVHTSGSGTYGSGTYGAASATPASPTPPSDDPYPSAGVETSGLQSGPGDGTRVTGAGVTGTEFGEQPSSRPQGDPFAPDVPSQTPLGDDTERRFR